MAVKKLEERPQGFNEYTNHEGERIRIDPIKAHNLLSLLEAAKSTGGDIPIIYVGEEGSGKSTQARQDAAFLDRTLTEERIEFNPEDAIKAHFKDLPEKWEMKAYMKGEYPNKPWQAIILDESAKLDRKRTMSAGSIEFTGFLSQSRQLHKIFFIVLPSIHMLESYIAEHRAVACIFSYKHEKTQLGFFKWYSRKHMRMMFTTEMHKRKLYPKQCSFMGRFSSRDPFDLTRYNQKKAGALNAYRKAEGLEKFIAPEELRLLFEQAALKNVIELGLAEKPVYTALGIPNRTWEDRKRAMIASGVVEKPKTGAAKRLSEITTSIRNSIPVVDNHGLTGE